MPDCCMSFSEPSLIPVFYSVVSLIDSLLPLIIIISGVSFIISSVNCEPWGTRYYPHGIIIGFLLIFFGIIWGITR